MKRVITLLSIFTFSWQALSQTVIVGQPIRALEAASSVVTEPPTNTLWFWYKVDENPNTDGAVMGTGANIITNSATLGGNQALRIFASGTTPPLYSNNIVNAKSAVVYPTNSYTQLIDADPGPTTIDGWTFIVVHQVTTPNTTFSSTVPLWQFNTLSSGVYYNILSGGNGLPEYWLYANDAGTAQALVTSSNDWQIISTRYNYASGVPEIRDNASTVVGATGARPNETVRNPRFGGVRTNGMAEILFYTNRLSDADLILARRYLTNKYAIAATP